MSPKANPAVHGAECGGPARRWHVFPEGRMCSIRGALLIWMLPLFLLVGAASAAVSYLAYSRMVSAFMDEQMQQLGHAVLVNEGYIPPVMLNAERVHKWGAYVVQVFDRDGQTVASTWPELKAPLQAGAGFHDPDAAGHRWRAYVAAPAGPSGHRVQVLQSGTFRQHLAVERAGAAIAPVLLLIPLSMLVMWVVARAMSRALQDIGRQAAAQDEHSIAELPTSHVPHEIAPLVVSFNSLLGRLRDAFATQRRFVQDAAHELRTPIAAIGLQLENLREDVAEGPARERFSHLEAGVRRAQRLVDQLLRLSKQEAAGADGPGMVDLKDQLRESINTLIALADQRNIDLGLVGAEQSAAPLTVRCAPGDLRSLLDNLIENALRYTPEGGVVDVRLVQEGGRVAVEVVDTGPGIPHDLLPRVFDRFFRVPGNGANGSGLGLAIAQAAAARCGLALTLRNRDDRSGLIARIETGALSSS
jgi:two-component system OmpR family sensor kinase